MSSPDFQERMQFRTLSFLCMQVSLAADINFHRLRQQSIDPDLPIMSLFVPCVPVLCADNKDLSFFKHKKHRFLSNQWIAESNQFKIDPLLIQVSAPTNNLVAFLFFVLEW